MKTSRDKIKDVEYFDRFIESSKSKYRKFLEKDKKVKIFSRAYILSYTSYEIFSALYSRGDRISEAEKWFRKFVQYDIEMYESTIVKDPEPYKEYFKNYLVRAAELGLCILINLPDDVEEKFVKQIDALEGNDPIWAKMIEFMGYSPAADAHELVLENLYKDLWACFTEDPHKRPERLENFVKNWYRQCARHRDGRTGKHNSDGDYYRGYWCFEAAAVAKMLDIDDSALKDHRHYPYDLRHR